MLSFYIKKKKKKIRRQILVPNSKFENYSSFLKMVLACDLLLGAPGTCAVPAMPASPCASSLLPGPVSVCPPRLLDTGQGRAGVAPGAATPSLFFPGSPLPVLSPHIVPSPPLPSPLPVLHIQPMSPCPRVLSGRTGACLSPCGLSLVSRSRSFLLLWTCVHCQGCWVALLELS